MLDGRQEHQFQNWEKRKHPEMKSRNSTSFGMHLSLGENIRIWTKKTRKVARTEMKGDG